LPAAAQELMVRLVRKSRSASGAAALALLVEGQALSARAEELATRAIAEVGDAASVLPLLRLYEAVPSTRPEIIGLLYNISGKVAFGSYWFSKEWRAVDEHLRGLDWEQLATWADNPFEHLGLRLFAVRVVPHVTAGTSVPILARLVGDRHEWPELSAQAADALAALDAEAAVLPAVVRLLRSERLWTAAVLAQEWSPENAAARAALEGEMVSPSMETRTAAFWVAAGVRDSGLRHVLEAGLRDAVPEVRMAAAWGLGELGDRSAVAVLEQHLDDPDDRVQAFVRASLAKLGVVVSASTGKFECEG
jgi:HEAT repeat protein